MPIKIQDLTHIYQPETPMAIPALSEINLEIADGECLGIIGATGSGKSTLVQHFNGLLKPTSGKIYVDGTDLTGSQVNWREIRRKVGLVFQYPEHQLFEETVEKDVGFGPRNLGLPEEEIAVRVREALKMVQLDIGSIGNRSPFSLSGGQMRRVAIAGVLAMRPKFLVLDEPTAGLDPEGRHQLLALIRSFHREMGMTVILVSHSMEDIAALTERVAVLSRGKLVMAGPTRQIFRRVEDLQNLGLGVPEVTMVMSALHRRGETVVDDVLTVPEGVRAVLHWLGVKRDAS